MKKTGKSFLVVFALGLFFFNLSVEKNVKSANTDFSSVNIQALQAYVQPTVTCESASQTSCIMYIDGLRCTSFGPMTIQY